MKPFIKTVAILVASSLLSWNATANERYSTPPPLTLSPDLSSPWTLQLKPLRRRATRAERRRARRPAGLQQLKQRAYRSVKPRRKKADRLAVRTGVQRSSRSSKITNTDPALLPTIVSYNGSQRPGDIIINTIERRLYLVLPGQKARRYAVGVGKPGFEWAGAHRVTRKATWPSWTPPKAMIARERKKGRFLKAHYPGGPDNPMGARALYLGSTLYRIHGTNQAWSIGKAVSSGCIRMRNEDVMDLYERVPVGTRVKVI